MLPYLDLQTPFPDVSEAFDEPNGLLAAGGDLSCERLMAAYRNGIFPWYSREEPILWWSPNPRTVFTLDKFKPSRSLKRFIKKTPLTITINQAFAKVISACAEPRQKETDTWITREMQHAYIRLHQQGFAHSVEVWIESRLVGGIYGVDVGQVFCGESMFSRVSNGSKVALTALIHLLKQDDYQLLDCQLENPHLMSLGAENISREKYLSVLKSGQKCEKPSILSQRDSINPEKLLSNW